MGIHANGKALTQKYFWAPPTRQSQTTECSKDSRSKKILGKPAFIFLIAIKGQIILKWFFGVFDFLQKRTKTSRLDCSHCLEGKNIHGSTGSAYLQGKDQSTVHKVLHRQGYRPACPRLSNPIHQHHGKNMERRSWTSTCNYSGGCQITC